MNSQKIAGIAWPSMLLVLTGMYAYWAVQRELVSSRPSIPSAYDLPDPGLRTVHSRMWEDPLASACADWKRLSTKLGAQKLHTVKDSVELEVAVKNVAARTDGLFQQVFCSINPDEEGWDPITDDARQHFRDLIQERSQQTLCLPVLVPGGPYAEDKEKRMRIRYAVVTALAESGYHLKFNSRMSYVVPKIFVRVLWGWQEREVVVPLKLYRPDDDRPQVLVFWLNESELGLRPLLATNRILHAIFSDVAQDHRNKLKVSIVGPASSGTLDWMSGESTSDHWKVASYAPMQRAGGFQPLLSAINGTTDTHVSIFSPRATAKYIEKIGLKTVKLFQVIGTDQQLATQIQAELKDRGALPGNIVLITEHDTSYGRRIVNTFETVLNKSLFTFRILRGIDGNLPGDDTGMPRAPSQQSGSDAPEVVERPPEGRSQYDYMKRLRQRIEQIDDVTAIGVVGSDVYDKLLVLRALKPYFPDAIFFTTDLHAIFTHPNERGHTRDLIVASHFGLTLGDELQKQTPPFRDSYQTATFLATRLAMHEMDLHRKDEQPDEKQNEHRPDATNSALTKVLTRLENTKRDNAQLAPLLHVVGRDRIQQLTAFDDGNLFETVHPSISSKPGASHLLFVAGVTLVVICAAFVWVNRDWVRMLVTLKSRDEVPTAEQSKRLRAWRWGLGTIFGILITAGGIVLWYSGQFEEFSLSGGYNTSARNLVYSVTGIFAVFALIYLVGRFIFTLQEETKRDARASYLAWVTFRMTHVLKATALALIVVYAGVLFVNGVSPKALWTCAILIGIVNAALFAVAWYCKWRDIDRDPDKYVTKNLMLSGNRTQAVKWAAGCVSVFILVSLLAWWAGRPPSGWAIASISRGADVRSGDAMAVTYAFGAIGALLSSLLFTHFWCREFSS